MSNRFTSIHAAFCAAAFSLATMTAAQAHAHLDHASPAVDSKVTTAPKQVEIWFTEALEPKFSRIVVRDANGAAMQIGAATLAPGSTTALRVAVKPLPPGRYRVLWRVLSVDTHRSFGEFDFRVVKP